jgi:hypothetical protein
MSQAAQPQPQAKKLGRPKKAEKNELPLILSMGVERSIEVMRIHCDGSDARTYDDYVRFVHEAQPVKGQLSLQEIEARFNAVAWSAIWKKDGAFRAWIKEQKKAEGAV